MDEEDHVLSVLAEKQCLSPLMHGTYNRTPAGIVPDFMLREVVSVPPDMGILDLAEIFVGEVGRRLIVVENPGG